jgi:hypothetical protein
MYWTIGSFPELEYLEPQERAQLLQRVPWTTIYAKIISRYVFLGVLVGLLGVAIVQREFNLTEPIAFLVPMVLVVIAGYVHELNRMRRSLRRTIIDAFRGQKLPFCMNCGYDLRAAERNRCPECGAAVMVTK